MKRSSIFIALLLVVLLCGTLVVAQDSNVSKVDNNSQNQPLFTLEKNTQQPFESQKIFKFTLLQPAKMNLSIFDLKGNKVRTLISDDLGPGVHDFVWDGTDQEGNLVKSGVYRYCLKMHQDEQSHIIAYLR